MRVPAFLTLLLALPVMAAEPSANMSGVDMGGQMTKLLLGLLLVIGLIFLLAWGLRRMQQFNPRSNQAIKLISSHALGPRERLLLVQVGSEQILLGLSAGRITPLHVLEEPVHLPDAEPANPEFAQRLMELLGRDQKDKP
ncbi:flagellar biosynthetic protein FliO [Stutzerimonas stutzeri]|uniref:flagellar biosynthetic protein FliO n=1 Tax=Stutzerimonas stutzeri TaxID=316 RepID=UPI00210D4F3A|nr:flagellar biosynthetic protein FliO [Stutzerimonas stutzeri]MCQ4240647.1 flagellar biosynthetic protein FliO [Stutzerimonas stutzeri]